MTSYIYALSDPRDPGKTRYIGKTNNIKRRIADHIGRAKSTAPVKRTHNQNWICQLLNAGLAPEIRVIKCTCRSSWAYSEMACIRSAPVGSLNNISKGGKGSSMEPETRAKLSAALQGRETPDSTRRKLSESAKMRRHSAETKLKMASRKRRPFDSKVVFSASKFGMDGEANHNAKLTAQKVLEMRSMESTHSTSMLAEIFGVHRSYVSQILRRKKWKSV